METYIIVIFIVLAVTIAYCYCRNQTNNKEHYSPGTINQLYAKGPEDLYLTYRTEQHVPEYSTGVYPFSYYLWNMPNKDNYGPLNGVYPYNYYTYPFYYW